MKSLYASLFGVSLVIASGVSHAGGYQHLLSPAITHTNGMRIASSTSSRSHNAYWQCDPGHIGYCDGEFHTPCTREWQKLGTRHCGRFVPPYAPASSADTQTAHSLDGLEQGQGESLGMLTADPVGLPAGIAPSAQAAAPETRGAQPIATPTAIGGNWLDAIKTLGDKIAGPER